MGVIVKTECQACENIHEEEFEGVLIAGYREQDGKMGVSLWHHELTIGGLLEILADVLSHLSDRVEELEREAGK